MKAIRLNAFAQQVDDVSWLVEGLLPDVGWSLLVGQKGLGKTTFALQLCSAIQKGTPFLGRKTVQRDICYIQADSGTEEWRLMVRRIAGESQGFTVIDCEPKILSSPIYISQLESIVKQINPGFIVWDSLYNLTAHNLNNEQVLMPIGIMRMISGVAPWLLIHHPPHGQTRASGHNSLEANCSNLWILLKTCLRIEKARLVAGQELQMRRDSQGLWMPYEETVRQQGRSSLDRSMF